MKVSILLFFFCGSLLIINAKFHYRMTKIECNASKKTVPERPLCLIKTYQRQSYLSICSNLTRKIPNAKVDYYNYRKNSDGYQKIIEFKQIEICKLVQNAASSSIPMMKSLVDYIKKNSNGNFLEACDLVGISCMNNFTVANFQLMDLYPAGEYMTNMLYYDEDDENIFNITLFAHLTKF